MGPSLFGTTEVGLDINVEMGMDMDLKMRQWSLNRWDLEMAG